MDKKVSQRFIICPPNIRPVQSIAPAEKKPKERVDMRAHLREFDQKNRDKKKAEDATKSASAGDPEASGEYILVLNHRRRWSSRALK